LIKYQDHVNSTTRTSEWSLMPVLTGPNVG